MSFQHDLVLTHERKIHVEQEYIGWENNVTTAAVMSCIKSSNFTRKQGKKQKTQQQQQQQQRTTRITTARTTSSKASYKSCLFTF